MCVFSLREDLVPGGNYIGSILHWEDFQTGGFCTGRFCTGGFCTGGFSVRLGGFCAGRQTYSSQYICVCSGYI